MIFETIGPRTSELSVLELSDKALFKIEVYFSLLFISFNPPKIVYGFLFQSIKRLDYFKFVPSEYQIISRSDLVTFYKNI